MDETREDRRPEPSGSLGPEVAPETAAQTTRTVPAADRAEPQPAARRIDAGNTALLIGIIVGLIGSVSVLIGVPVFLLNEEVNRVSDSVESLSDRMDTRFDIQDAKIERLFATQDAKIERRFDTQDAKIEDLRRGQSEISQQLAVLVASLGRTDAADAVEG